MIWQFEKIFVRNMASASLFQTWAAIFQAPEPFFLIHIKQMLFDSEISSIAK